MAAAYKSLDISALRSFEMDRVLRIAATVFCAALIMIILGRHESTFAEDLRRWSVAGDRAAALL
jgi:hypothetical protein